jgi:hypothetical protein
MMGSAEVYGTKLPFIVSIDFMHMQKTTVIAPITPQNQASVGFLLLGQPDTSFLSGCYVCGCNDGRFAVMTLHNVKKPFSNVLFNGSNLSICAKYWYFDYSGKNLNSNIQGSIKAEY